MERPSYSALSPARFGLIRFTVALLRPLLRLLLRHGISYPEFNQISRWLYVDIAMREREFFLPRKRQQHKARVACLTGLSRKEVLRLSQTPEPEANNELHCGNRASRVLQGWVTDPRFADASGKPAQLSFTGKQGKANFAALVQCYSGDIPPRAILDELLLSGNCRLRSTGEVEVIEPEFATLPWNHQKMTEAANRLSDMIQKINIGELPAAENETVKRVTAKAVATA